MWKKFVKQIKSCESLMKANINDIFNDEILCKFVIIERKLIFISTRKSH